MQNFTTLSKKLLAVKKFSLMLFVMFASCGMKDDITKKDSPTSGTLTLMYDEGLALHIQNQIYTFSTIYKYANITTIASNEKNCIEALYNDSCKAIAITRQLNADELQKFKSKNIYPHTSVVAKTAIAFIVNKNFSDSLISIQMLESILEGNDSSYVKGKRIQIIFDNQNSGNTRQLKDSLMSKSVFGKNCSTVTSTKQLVDALSKNESAIGVCDYAWLSDKDDSITKQFYGKIKILAVSKTNNAVAYMPDQSNIATGDYPFCRNICIIRRSAEFSLAKGIETFIAGEKGQLMFLKQGLPPNRQEERLIEIDLTPLPKK